MWPTWLTDLVVKEWGFAVPLMYAAATYGVFHWLDKKASGPAKRALTTYLQSAQPSRELVANFSVEVFDKIYSYPLFRWRAVLRSAVVTIVVCALVGGQLGMLAGVIEGLASRFAHTYTLLVLTNILTDFASLFLIRYLLQLAPRRPVLSLIVAFIAGVTVVYCGFLIRVFVDANITSFILFDLKFGWDYIIGRLGAIPLFLANMASPFNPVFENQLRFMIPAAVVHVWLPVFALAVLLTEFLGRVFRAANWMQWFLKQGQRNPFEAVGYVAALIVFVIGATFQLASR